MCRKVLSVFIVLLIVGTVSVFAATRCVPVLVAGCDSSDATIQTAINNASAGDTILVAPGTFFESINITEEVTLQSSGGAAATTIDGVAGADSIAIGISASNVTIRGFTISNNGGAFGIDINQAPSTDNILIENNIFDDIGGGDTCCGSQGIWIEEGNGITIQNNVFQNIFGTASTKGILVSQSSIAAPGLVNNLLVRNNTFSNITSTAGAYGFQVSGPAQNIRVLNNDINNLNGCWTTAIGLENDINGGLIEGNTISNLNPLCDPSFDTAINIEDAGAPANSFTTADTILIRCNNFIDVTTGVLERVVDTDQVNATLNWWGAASGPSSSILGPSIDPVTAFVANGSGAIVIGTDATLAASQNNVRFDPWLSVDSSISAICNPVTGGDPPIWGDILAFPTPERALGVDLDNNGWIGDTVLRIQNVETGQITNTGVAVSGRHRNVDMHEDTIVFVEETHYPAGVIGTYNVKTGAVTSTGVLGFRPTIYGNTISVSGNTIRYYDLDTQSLIETGVPGEAQALWSKTIAYHRASHSAFHPTIRYYDITTGKITNTKVAGIYPAIYENWIAFTTEETLIAQDLNNDGDMNDSVVRYYDTNSQTLYNTGQAGQYPAIFGSHIVFSAGKQVMYYDIERQATFSTGVMGTEPDIYENTITYYLWEAWAQDDINRDGDRQDPIVRTYQITNEALPLAATNSTVATSPLSAPLTISSLTSSPNPVTTSSAVTFRVAGNGIDNMQVEVYDLAGRNVYISGFTSGNALRWNLLTDQGQTVANGVYLYVVTARGAQQQVVRSQVKKMVVLR